MLQVQNDGKEKEDSEVGLTKNRRGKKQHFGEADADD